ncbi:MAG TPA: M15 family metallopeptidase [Marmoricola sp.]|nr:M15 family metallopeptidase [Marmoricola sp.]
MTRRRPRLAALCAVGVTAAALLGGCAPDAGSAEQLLDTTGGSPSSTPVAEEPTPAPPSYAVDPPGPFEPPLRTADVLVTGAETLPDDLVEGIEALDGVEEVLRLSVAAAAVDGRTLTVAAVDPGEFRRFTPDASAKADFVWKRLAGGEVAVDLSVSKKLVGKDDMMPLGNAEDSPTLHVGAYAPLVKRIDAVVNTERGEQLDIPEHNALLVSTGELTPSALEKELERVIGDRATMQTLALELDVGPQTAVLTGGSVSEAVGTFSYTNRPNGEISPDPAWVKAYVRTEEVPILGTVTCNKAFLPQLRGALTEVVARGLADKIHPDEYAGCYYPRYIGRDASNGLSLHSWGIAVDLNVPGNLRGTVGEIDRQVVAIFKRWGMAWGGDWSWTDPMHFEMNAVVRPG